MQPAAGDVERHPPVKEEDQVKPPPPHQQNKGGLLGKPSRVVVVPQSTGGEDESEALNQNCTKGANETVQRVSRLSG